MTVHYSCGYVNRLCTAYTETYGSAYRIGLFRNFSRPCTALTVLPTGKGCSQRLHVLYSRLCLQELAVHNFSMPCTAFTILPTETDCSQLLHILYCTHGSTYRNGLFTTSPCTVLTPLPTGTGCLQLLLSVRNPRCLAGSMHGRGHA